MMKKSTIRTIARRDRGDMQRQLKRYDKECGPVVTYTVDLSVYAQSPVSVLRLDSVRA